MDFNFTEEQKMIANTAKEIAKNFPPEYWREKDLKEEFGEEFYKAIGKAGFTGMVIPEKYGGAGKGVTELLIAMEELAANGCGMAGVWYLVITEDFGGISIIRHGTEAQKEKYLPRIASGDIEFCMGLTEPDAGTNTLNTKTRAQKVADGWIINGNKTWISGADRARGMMLITRTTPKEKAPKKTFGISLFLIDLPNPAVNVTTIPKHGINYSHSCDIGINDLKVSEDALMPPLDGGWYSLLDTLNIERMSFTTAAIGIARLAMSKAIDYSKDRKVFGDMPIGSYQGLQFNLAEAYAGIEAAKLLNFKASTLYDNGASIAEVGNAVNPAKILAVESGIKAVYWAMQTFGGYGYAREYDVERWWREINLIRLAPVSQQMALNYVGEHILGMPRSYE
ncbi:MAG: acyl-CoA dehydrogenase [Chloroflexi bacterium CG15_BIG_FIL_POST_REV_8_21_14_020_46_15]|nr:MAG: acyl-CoA dehydrogenase [Chloroflexi bacterium CG15_BIG_FIL_POST_REV_8_21_14_020_46_15]